MTLSLQNTERFDLCALLKLLEAEGITFDKLFFDGSTSRRSHGSLTSSVVFDQDQYFDSFAKVHVNLGMLVGTSPLPSYFRNCMEKGEIDEDQFLLFLQYFNHHVIRNFLKITWIEHFIADVHRESHRKRSLSLSRVLEVGRQHDKPTQAVGSLADEWRTLQLSNLMLLGMDSVSSIHWAFSLCFPELGVNVEKCCDERRLACADFNLGISTLGGKAALGGYFKQSIRAYSVALRSDVEQTETRVFWPQEIRSRLFELIFPLLCKTHVYLVLSFTIDQYKRATHMNRLSRLGFTSIGEATSNFTWRLYKGYARIEQEIITGR